jgi:hypothetical protein
VVGAATKEDGLTALHFAAQVSAPFLCPHTNTVRSFSTHEQQSPAQGSSTNVSRSDIRLIQIFGLLGSRSGPEVALN